ncbi:rhomboid family intramembrane serine protease [Polyangium spumosum]|uniref:Rhomboid family intramembrane serine protease n=1 Tax=Polyangium spumosum TaxID=889282 RepID=A0A6N7PQG0_9BACT|nr:rhomboid family intramembrane serine protease [Polyangium spumosum]MRG91091.1 rhomboid family intramembrane serine protease [Polyangium spumosum]
MRPSPLPFVLPRPGKAISGMMIAITVLWVGLALSINWVEVGASVAQFMAGTTSGVLRGQIWRLFTAPLFHDTSRPGHFLMTLLGLYFLAPTLESRWGARRMLIFLFGAGAFAFATQVAVGALIPKLNAAVWFGGLGMIEAVAVAWALQNRDSQVRMFFVLPVSAYTMVAIIFVLSVLNVIALNQHTPEGLVTPFGGMLAGWLFGDRSPLRRLYLKLRLRQIQAQTASLRAEAAASAAAARARRASGPPLRVIEGGSKTPPKDKRYLN